MSLEQGIPFRFPALLLRFLAPHDFWVAVRRPGLLPRNAVRHPLASRLGTTRFLAASHVGIDPH